MEEKAVIENNENGKQVNHRVENLTGPGFMNYRKIYTGTFKDINRWGNAVLVDNVKILEYCGTYYRLVENHKNKDIITLHKCIHEHWTKHNFKVAASMLNPKKSAKSLEKDSKDSSEVADNHSDC